MRNLIRKKLIWKIILSSAFFFVGAIFVLSSPGSVSAACEDTLDHWGINTGNVNHGAGLVVRTQNSSGAALGGIGWVLRTATGPSILHLQSSLPYNDIGWDSARAFFTATGPSNTGQFHGAVWCNAGRTTRGSFKGYSVLGVGSSLWYGNNMLLSCKRYLGAWDDACDSNLNGTCTDEPAETYRIPENEITHPGGQSGHWTGSLAGWGTGFTVPNGRTTRITLTWHEDAVIPDPPTNTLRVRSSNPSSGVGITQLHSCSGATGGTTPYDRPMITDICTDIRAPQYVAGDTKKFSHWEGCDSIYPNVQDCRADVVGGVDQTVTAHYVNNTGRIQGIKVGPNPAASQTVKLNGGSATTANPYAYNNLVAGNYTVSVSKPAGWKVGYTLCYNKTNCHNNAPTMASSVVVNVPAAGYADLWWHYYPLDLVVKSVVITNGTEFHVGDEVLVNVTVENDENTKGGTAGAFWVEVCPSGNKPLINCPNAGTGKWTYKEKIPSLASGVSVVETFSFPAPDPGSYPKTYTLIARADLPDPGNVLEAVEYTNNWGKATYKVIGPPPWFHTRGGGDVGSYKKIEPKTTPTGVGYSSADYLVISEGTITKFTSVRKWLVPSYTIGINLKPAPGSSIYQVMFNKYTKQCLETIVDATTPGAIAARINTTGCNILVKQGNLTINNNSWYPLPPKGYRGPHPPAVVFVNGNMNIRRNMAVGADNGLIFVVKGNITVAKKVIRADGVYLFDGDYDVKARKYKNEDQLLVKGSVIGAFNNGRFRLDRDFRSIRSRHEPTEIFEFEPKYLWLFRDFLGDEKARFEEVAP